MPNETSYVSGQVNITHYEIDHATVDRQAITKAARPRFVPPKDVWLVEGEPAISLVSDTGESQILIGKINVSYLATIPPRSQRNKARAMDVLLEEVPLLFRILSIIGAADSVVYAGALVQAIIETEASDADVLKVIEEHYSADFGEEIIDLNIVTTRELEEDHYANVTVSNTRTFGARMNLASNLTRVDSDDAVSRGIAVTCDFNSRLGYNRGKAPQVTIGTTKSLIHEAFAVTQGTTDSLLERLPRNE